MGVRGESIRAYRMGIGCEATPVREQPRRGEQGYEGLYGRLK